MGSALPARSPFGASDPNAKARRLARALVSDIVTYHPERRDQALANGTLKREFLEEIKKSWEEYLLTRYPTAFAKWLQAVQVASGPIDEVAIVGDADDDATRSLARTALHGLALRRVVAAAADPDRSAVPLLHGRERVGGAPTAYVCRSFACRLPVTDPEALAEQLAAAA